MKTRIRQLREERKLSQTGLALQIGTTQTTLSKIESGTSVPDAELAVHLADFFSVSVDYLLCVSNVRLTLERECVQQGISRGNQRILTLYQNLNRQQRNAVNTILEGINEKGHAL